MATAPPLAQQVRVLSARRQDLARRLEGATWHGDAALVEAITADLAAADRQLEALRAEQRARPPVPEEYRQLALALVEAGERLAELAAEERAMRSRLGLPAAALVPAVPLAVEAWVREARRRGY